MLKLHLLTAKISQNMNIILPRISFLCVCACLLFSVKPSQSATTCHPNDQKVLLQIKNHFHNASSFSTWLPETDCCSWSGIKCDDNDTNPGRVTVFNIYGANDIVGQIPPVFGDLHFLRRLKFRMLPNLTGPIPLTFSKLTSLQFLDLSLNNLTGPIPDFWGLFKNLEFLGLQFNSLSGPIPPTLSLLPKIKNLALMGNTLTGSIPESFGSFKTRLSLGLSMNQLSGTIPRSLGRANFTSFGVMSNQFTGDVSFLFGRDKPLQHIWLGQNKFKFDFTNVDLPQELNTLYIDNNEIYGSLPQRLGELPMLRSIDVSYNQLCGHIPTSRYFSSDPYSFSHNKCLCDAPLPPCKVK